MFFIKKIFLILALVLFPLSQIQAQLNGQSLIDSLKAVLSKSDADTSRVFTLIRLSRAYVMDGDIETALITGEKALELSRKLNNLKCEAASSNAIAVVYFNKGDMANALKFYLGCLKIADMLHDSLLVSRAYNGIGNVNLLNGNYDEALKYHMKAKEINLKNNYRDMLHHSYNNLGNINLMSGHLDAAKTNFEAALIIRKELGLLMEVADIYNNLGVIFSHKKQYDLAIAEYEKSLAINEQLENLNGIAIDYNNIGSEYIYKGDYKAARSFLNKALHLSKQIGSLDAIQTTYHSLAELDSASGNFAGETANFKMFIIYRDSIHNVETAREQTKTQMLYEFDKKEALSRAEQEKKDALAQIELHQQKIIRNGFLSGFTVMLIFSGIVLVQRNRIKKGKKRSDELLLNILPAETAEELKLKGTAEARSYDEVTVMFTDLKNFTRASAQLTASNLVHEMNYIYSSFDQITDKHNLEKIKTIGDSYMCAGGLPAPNNSHPKDAVLAALEMQQFFTEFLLSGSPLARQDIGLRIGIHTGPVVAGIVGVKKFAYDIWGDTVNIASRMESSGEPGRVNISESTFGRVKQDFKCEPRGKVEAKNRGLISMYFVDNTYEKSSNP